MSCVFVIGTATEHPRLYQSRERQERRWADAGLWPTFIEQNTVSKVYSARIDEYFSDYQLLALGEPGGPWPDQVVGVAHAVPVNLPSAALPDTGWEWAVCSSVEGREAGVEANALCGLSVTVDRACQHRGIATALLERLHETSTRAGLPRVVVPVRPLLKSQWPDVTMDDFASLRRADGAHVDPWVRTHERLGARIVGVCHRSMRITVSLDRWRELGAVFDGESGSGSISGGLAPLVINGSEATYTEPNIWMQYDLGGIS